MLHAVSPCRSSELLQVLLLGARHLDHELGGAVHNNEEVIQSLFFDHVASKLCNEDTLANLEQFASFGKLLVNDALRVAIEEDAQESTHRVDDSHIDTDNAHVHDGGEHVGHDALVVDEKDEIIAEASLLLVDEESDVRGLFINHGKRPVKRAVLDAMQLEVDVEENCRKDSVLLFR